MATRTEATIDDLYRVGGKAELVNGEIVLLELHGCLPARAAGAITLSLHSYERRTTSGFAIGGNAGFVVNLAHRQSFCPDAAFFIGRPTGMKFLDGVPVFAAEVRSEGDYSARAEQEMAAKRTDYFAAGTIVVWDVDLLDEDVVRVYRASDPTNPTKYRRSDMAEAEPAVPGWRMAVEELFE
jgi:Uma2 family endonuclease